MNKPRLLIPMSIQFSVRYVVRSGLLDRLREVAHPVVLLGWRDDELANELARNGAEVHQLPEGRIGKNYDRVRSWMNFIQKKQLNTPSEGIWERRAALFRAPHKNFRRRARKQFFPPRPLKFRRHSLAISQRARAVAVGHQSRRVARACRFPQTGCRPEPHTFFRHEEMTLRACSERQIPMCVSVLSFDNITTRGWWPGHFRALSRRNRYNAAELLRAYPGVDPRRSKSSVRRSSISTGIRLIAGAKKSGAATLACLRIGRSSSSAAATTSALRKSPRFSRRLMKRSPAAKYPAIPSSSSESSGG